MKNYQWNFFKGLGLGVGFAGVLIGCAHYTYQVYGLDVDAAQLVAKNETLPLTVCRKSPDNAFPCIVLKSQEYYKLKAKFELLDAQLKACQKGQK
jgi:hypothetical protein